MGRPPFEVTDEVLIKVQSLASQGLTKKQIAKVLGICYMTLNRNEKKNSEFSDAIKEGQAKGVATITNALFKSAKAGQVTSMIFWLKNRAPDEWKDRVPEITHHVAPPTRIEIVTVDGRKES